MLKQECSGYDNLTSMFNAIMAIKNCNIRVYLSDIVRVHVTGTK